MVKSIDTGTLWRTAAGLLAGCAGLALLTGIGVVFDFSHPATGALSYMIVVVLVSIIMNMSARSMQSRRISLTSAFRVGD